MNAKLKSIDKRITNRIIRLERRKKRTDTSNKFLNNEIEFLEEIQEKARNE